MDALDAPPALDSVRRAHLDRALEHLGLGLSDLDAEVRTRIELRARRPDVRLTVGRYLILGELGRGGMGVVYEAWDPGIERKVAIKTLEPDLVPEEDRREVVERFRRETKIVARLEHPSVVTVYDVGLDRSPVPSGEGWDVIHFYVMELLEGASLGQRLREDGPMERRRALEITRSLAEALALAHGAGVIHRDIKPSNVFLRDRGDAVLLDFGIAKSGSVALTRQGQILGTPSYLAPERLREKEAPIDGRADLFSLGVLMFTMIAGDAPFVGGDVYEVIDKIAKEAHPALGGDSASARALERVVDRLLAKRPEDRFQEARLVVEALDGVLDLIRVEGLADEPRGRVVPPPPPEAKVEPPSGGVTIPEVELEASPPPSSETYADPEVWPDDEPYEAAPTAVGPPPVGAHELREETDEHETPAAETDVEVEAHVGFGEDDELTAADADAGPFDTRPELSLHRETRELAASPRLPEVDEETVADPALGKRVPDILARGASLGASPKIEVSLVHEAEVMVVPAVRSETDEPAPAAFVGTIPKAAEAAQLVTEEIRRDRRRPRVGRETKGPPTPARPHRPARPLPSDRPSEQPGGRRGAEPASSRVRVRVWGSLVGGKRSRQRFGGLGLLAAAALLSVAVGLFLGRRGVQPVAPSSPVREEGVSVSVVSSAPVESAREVRALLVDADAARSAGELEEAVRLYTRISEVEGASAEEKIRASLGRADVLKALGRTAEASSAYREVRRLDPNGSAGEQARIALREFAPKRPREPAASASPPRRATAEPNDDAVPKRTGLSPESACRELLFRHAKDPAAAVDAFRALVSRHPDAPCARWNLAVKLEHAGKLRAAARAYRGYLDLVPETPRRAAVEARIEKLEGRP